MLPYCNNKVIVGGKYLANYIQRIPNKITLKKALSHEYCKTICMDEKANNFKKIFFAFFSSSIFSRKRKLCWV